MSLPPPAPRASRAAPSLLALILAAAFGAGGLWAFQHHGTKFLALDGPAGELVTEARDLSDEAGDLVLGPGKHPAKASTARGVTTVPLSRRRGGLYAPVVLNGTIRAEFMIDSGASQVCLSAETARALIEAGQLTRADFRGNGGAILADGTRVPARIYNLRSLRIGGRELKNVTAVVSAGRGPGELLLGQNVLRRFKRWSVDNRDRVLTLED